MELPKDEIDSALEFIRRTKGNLEFIEFAAEEDEKKGKTNARVWEVTQLVNSTLGLIIFPSDALLDSITTPLHRLPEWPDIKVVRGSPAKDTLHQLVKGLRNGLAHHNVEFINGKDKKISRLRIWNCTPPEYIEKIWEVSLSIDDLRTFCIKFSEMLVRELKGHI